MIVTYHPVTTLLGPVSLNLNLQPLSTGVILGLDCLGQFAKLVDRRRLYELLVIEVVEQKVQSFLRVLDLRREVRRRLGHHPLHVLAQDIDQRLCAGGDM